MSTSVEQEPLELEAFPSQLRKHVEPEAPEKLKQAAAQGMAPAPPDQTIRLLYQLHFDDDESIRSAAADALEDMPQNVVVEAAEDEAHVGVLDWIAEQRGDEPTIVETLLRNDHSDDHTFARLARDASTEICELIATNEVRALHTPDIIEELYQNSNARMSTVDQLLELAQRNDVSLSGLPGVERALQSDSEVFGDEASEADNEEIEDEEGMSDEAFNQLLQQEMESASKEEMKLEEIENNDNLTRSQKEKLRKKIEEQAEEEESRRGITEGELLEMTVPEKIRLATVGSRAAVKKLVKDPNKMVHMAAIESPRIKTPDAVRLASKKSLPEGVISYIANNKEWTQNYKVAKNLAFNPKTPVQDTMDLLKRLRNDDLQKLQDSREVPHQISRAAERLYKKRTGRSGGRGR